MKILLSALFAFALIGPALAQTEPPTAMQLQQQNDQALQNQTNATQQSLNQTQMQLMQDQAQREQGFNAAQPPAYQNPIPPPQPIYIPPAPPPVPKP